MSVARKIVNGKKGVGDREMALGYLKAVDNLSHQRN